MNVVSFIGNLASDVELRDVGEDKKVANFLVAIRRPGDGSDADFIRVTVWNKQGENCARFLSKGKRVGVDGRLRSHSWEDGDGKRRSSIEVVANRVEFLSPPPAESGATPFEPAAAA